MLPVLCNRAEEYSHAGSSERDHGAQASDVEQGKADGRKATAATQTRLVDPDKVCESTEAGPHIR